MSWCLKKKRRNEEKGRKGAGIILKDSGAVDKVDHDACDALGRKIARTEDDSPTAVTGWDYYENF